MSKNEELEVGSSSFSERLNEAISGGVVRSIRKLLASLEPLETDSNRERKAKRKHLGEIACRVGNKATLSDTIRYLGQIGDRYTDNILASLQDNPSPSIRMKVAANISNTGSRRAVVCLVNFTNDPSPVVREWACFMLGQLKLGRSTRTIAVECLRKASEDRCNRVRVNAIRALVYQGFTGSGKLLREHLDMKQIDMDRLCELFASFETQFSELGMDEEIADALVEFVRGELFPSR